MQSKYSQESNTLIGSTSILLWATWPSLAVYAAPAPIFLILFAGQTISFLLLAVLRVLRGDKIIEMLPKTKGLFLFGTIGVLGTNVFNFIAISRIPAAQASVLNYLWPLIAILLSSMFGLMQMSVKHYVALLLAFIGVIFVINPFGELSFDIAGIASALSAALCYATYTTYRQVDRNSPPDAVGIYALISAVFCLGIFWASGESYELEVHQYWAILFLGMAPMGLAYAIWDFGVAHGNARTLSILAYATPLLATLLLIIFGLSLFTVYVLVGAVLIVAAAFIATWK